MAMRPPQLSPEAQTALATYDFLGNDRELKNLLERALIESGGEVLDQAEPLVFLLLAARNVAGHCRGPDD
jgi:DNA-binding NtrC family response regulator